MDGFDWHISMKGAFGWICQQVSAPANRPVCIPDGLDFTMAAALPVSYTTAMVALSECVCVQPSDSVLVHAASGLACWRAIIDLCVKLFRKPLCRSERGRAKLSGSPECQREQMRFRRAPDRAALLRFEWFAPSSPSAPRRGPLRARRRWSRWCRQRDLKRCAHVFPHEDR